MRKVPRQSGHMLGRVSAPQDEAGETEGVSGSGLAIIMVSVMALVGWCRLSKTDANATLTLALASRTRVGGTLLAGSRILQGRFQAAGPRQCREWTVMHLLVSHSRNILKSAH